MQNTSSVGCSCSNVLAGASCYCDMCCGTPEALPLSSSFSAAFADLPAVAAEETVAPAAEERTFGIVLCNQAKVEAELIKLAKRCSRKGLPVLTWTWGKAYLDTIVVTRDESLCVPVESRLPTYDGTGNVRVTVTRVPLTIHGDPPKYAGWTFAAELQHIEGETIVRGLPGLTIPAVYRSRGPVCDHCKHKRMRNDTYVLTHTDGRFIQVGSTCIRDFLGSDAAGDLAFQASIVAQAIALASGLEDDFSFGGSGRDDRLTVDFLGYVAWCVRELGWTSRTAAKESCGEKRATADIAWTLTTDKQARSKMGCVLTDADTTLAAEAEAWGEAISDEEIERASSDYLHNLRASMRVGLTTFKTAGIAASVVTAYQRAIGRARLAAERAAAPKLDAYLGTPKSKLTINVTLDFVTGFGTDYGYTTVLKFRTAEGASVVWKATSTDLGRDDVGKKYTLTGTVKKHEEYKGAKQTIVTRCKLKEIATASA